MNVWRHGGRRENIRKYGNNNEEVVLGRGFEVVVHFEILLSVLMPSLKSVLGELHLFARNWRSSNLARINWKGKTMTLWTQKMAILVGILNYFKISLFSFLLSCLRYCWEAQFNNSPLQQTLISPRNRSDRIQIRNPPKTARKTEKSAGNWRWRGLPDPITSLSNFLRNKFAAEHEQ